MSLSNTYVETNANSGRHRQGGPTVDWSIIQPKFGQVDAEVLILLDSCYAAQAARTNQKRTIPPNMELVAACAMGLKTKLPGNSSFTTNLIRQMRSALVANGTVKVSEIVNSLAHRDSGYGQSPVHFTGLENGTICLEPFDSAQADESVARRESAWLTLRISLRDVVSENLISELIRWLKAHPRRKVSKLTVEDLVQSTSSLHHFIHEDARAVDRGPKLCQLTPSGQQDVAIAWSLFRALLADLATRLQLAPSMMLQSAPSDSTASDGNGITLRPGPDSLVALEHGLSSLQAAVQRGVMASPDLHSSREALLQAVNADSTKELGLTPFLDLRLKAHFPSEAGLSLKTDHAPEPATMTTSTPKRLAIEQLRDGTSIIVEYKTYDQKTLRKGDLERMQERLQNLAELLQTPLPADFHTLQCLRWFHQPEKARFGLVLRPPEGSLELVSLKELIDQPKLGRKPTLGQRFAIANYIGEALLKWHRSANWVHQGISSQNIYCQKSGRGLDFVYSKPILCGFEFARHISGISQDVHVEDFDMNVYRHPNRQGAPIEHHTKQHDLYSFGILMFEIGAWKLINTCFDSDSRQALSPSKMQKHIRSMMRKYLGHNMGLAYEQAAIICLDAKFEVKLDDPAGSNLSKAFEQKVLDRLKAGLLLD